jgi:hypothetical protein
MKDKDRRSEIMQGVLVMKTAMLIFAACAVLFTAPVQAEDENWGTIKHGSSSKVGEYELYSDGTSSQTIGSYKFYSDGTSEQSVGAYTFDSKGGTSHRIGDYTFRSDGRSGQDIGAYHFYEGGSINSHGTYKFRVAD